MRKLHVKIDGKWHMVFCRDANRNRVICTDDPQKALPCRAAWADEDLQYFRTRFSDMEFCLKKPGEH